MHPSFYKRPFLIVFLVYVLFLALFLEVPKPKQDDIFYKIPAKAEISAYINSYPRVKGDKQLFTVDILTLNGVKQKGKVYLTCKDCPELLRGQIINFDGDLFIPGDSENYGSFKWKKYLARKYIFTQGNIDRIIKIESPKSFWFYLGKIRTSILNVFWKNLPPNSAAILSGITLGEKGDISDTLYTAFQDSGAMHLLVASGGNVGFVTLIVYFLCSLFIGGRKRIAFTALAAALVYTLIAGADAPLLRAYLMTVAGTIGFILGRKSGIMQGLLLAAFFILIVNPQSLFEVGFQMSILATCAIILFTSNFKINYKIPPVLRWSLELLFVSLCAQSALVPVFTNYFYKISFSAVFSNLFLVPLSAVLMVGGFILWLASFANYIFVPVLSVIKFLLLCFEYLVNFFAGLPMSNITVPALKSTTIIAYYILLFYVLNLPLFKKKLKSFIIVLVLAILVFSCGVFIKPQEVTVLKGRYNLNVILREGGQTKMLGASISGSAARKALLALGTKEINCLFINSLSKSYFYMLHDFDLEIKNIYIPYGEISKEVEPLLIKTNAKIIPAFAEQDYCGVSVENGWVLYDGVKQAGTNNNLSFKTPKIDTAANLKAIGSNGQFVTF
ncbi:MAG: ComEC/Rec2 family competence protein [Elusimicrobiaceae bacterium]|nr:ComEC/Rec2 family competence protein [Elusimicrobiaceae bacterium]